MNRSEDNGKPTPSESRARSHPVIDDVNDRVGYICELMVSRAWTKDTNRRLRREIGAAWMVTESTVQNYSAEAGRLLVAGIRESRFEAAELALDTLRTICRNGVMSGIPGDSSAARAAAADLLKFAGIDQPDDDKIQRHIVMGADVSPAKAGEVMRGLFGAVTPDNGQVVEPDHTGDPTPSP